ncbi:hypothetical protein [Nitratidesulfovibrio liaohensis]|uniref:hypothetical protein n=1 Tax=Nitratidesulfovibrio liaohensis TaxID=2604158 RepID=UPI00141FD53D|nr:hypothetical protein [Nitratidesulfovibrio liaohensis]NHZ46300.1 hypothetical protein [Nitratidesulfovibrio liaohensis]
MQVESATYQSKDNQTKIFIEDGVTNLICNQINNMPHLDQDTNTIQFKTETPSLSLLNVFKSFVKIAITISPDDQISEFQETTHWILGKLPSIRTPWQAEKVLQWYTPGYYREHPLVILLKRKDDFAPIPKFIIVIEYSHYMITAYIPFVKSDKNLKNIEIVTYPHPMLRKMDSDVMVTILDMSSDKKISYKGEHFLSIIGDVLTVQK